MPEHPFEDGPQLVTDEAPRTLLRRKKKGGGRELVIFPHPLCVGLLFFVPERLRSIEENQFRQNSVPPETMLLLHPSLIHT